MPPKKGGLGKGLDALFIDNTTEQRPVTLRLFEIEPNKDQPRKDFDETALGDLADSIREHGVLQPLLVRPMPLGGYQLVAGERRWRAAKLAGIEEVPVIIKELSDEETVELALIENLQRQDLNPFEEALGYQTLQEQYSLTQEQIAKAVAKSRPAVANALRLLSLPAPVAGLIREGKITAGHGRALLSFGDEKTMAEVAGLIVQEDLSVRTVEKMAQAAQKKPAKPTATVRKNPFVSEMELALAQEMGRKISISSGKRKKIEIEYFDEDDLKEIARRLCLQSADGSYYDMFRSDKKEK